MFECEKCIHQEICDQSSRLRWACLMEEQRCSDFKDQFSFVEVVRCKDCVHRKVNFFVTAAICEKVIHTIENDNDFCSYGKKVE